MMFLASCTQLVELGSMLVSKPSERRRRHSKAQLHNQLEQDAAKARRNYYEPLGLNF